MGLRIAALVLAAVCAASRAGAVEIRGGCDVTFLGTSTLHDFSGTAGCSPFAAPLVRDGAGHPVIPAVEVEVAVAGMDTRNEKRDRQMRDMFQNALFPLIRGVFHDVDPDRIRQETKKGQGKAPLDFSLRIREIERPVRASVTNLKEEGRKVTFDLTFPVSLKEYDLKPPTVFGFIRVGDRVTVTARVRIEMPGDVQVPPPAGRK